jgi:hypothetical protein
MIDEQIHISSYEDYLNYTGKSVDGKTLMCAKHGLEYRITCDECQEKYGKFSALIRESIMCTCECHYGSATAEPDCTCDCHKNEPY